MLIKPVHKAHFCANRCQVRAFQLVHLPHHHWWRDAEHISPTVSHFIASVHSPAKQTGRFHPDPSRESHSPWLSLREPKIQQYNVRISMYTGAKDSRIMNQTGLDSLQSDQIKLPDESQASGGLWSTVSDVWSRPLRWFWRYMNAGERDISRWYRRFAAARVRSTSARVDAWIEIVGEGVSITGVSREWSEWGRG